MRTRRRRQLQTPVGRCVLGLMVLLVLAVLSGCSLVGDGGDSTPVTTRSPAPLVPPTAEPMTYVAVGASETVGVGADDPAHQAWPRVFHDRSLPTSRYVNVGVSGATVRDALATQLPRALASRPDEVTVWLAVNDVVSLVPVRDYATSLRTLVHALRRGGRTEVLVANVPPLELLPSYRACLPAAGSSLSGVVCLLPLVPTVAEVRRTVAEFNRAIARVVATEGAVLVDLSAQRDLARLTAADGFHPNTRGHRLIAQAFEAARTARPLGGAA